MGAEMNLGISKKLHKQLAQLKINLNKTTFEEVITYALNKAKLNAE
jgi:hypothetical protein